MLAHLLLSLADAAVDLVPLPPGGEFASSVDARAASLGQGLSCNARDGLDLAGDAAYVWGANFHVASASQCCEACAAHAAACGPGEDPKRSYWDDSGRQLRCGRSRGKCNVRATTGTPTRLLPTPRSCRVSRLAGVGLLRRRAVLFLRYPRAPAGRVLAQAREQFDCAHRRRAHAAGEDAHSAAVAVAVGRQ
jgi:hypothetical protein